VNDISVVDLGSNQVSGPPISIGFGPFGIAITPDGRTAYASNVDSGFLETFDTASHQISGAVISVGGGPYGTAVTPDGSRVYVASGGESVAAIDTSNNAVGLPITVGADPEQIAILPDRGFAYVTDYSSGDVSVVDLSTDRAVAAIPVGTQPM